MGLHMVVTDLDGTLLDPEQRLSPTDRQTLVELGEAGILRVVATGRSLFSACKVLGPHVPIDFLAHSSGAGIVTWPQGRPIRAVHMPAPLASELVRVLSSRRLDFMLHRAIPDNHHFLVHRTSRANDDFERRLKRYASYASELRLPFEASQSMCQAIVIEPGFDSARHAELEAALPEFRVIRTTSPLDGASTWIEIFPKGVGKAAASAWLMTELGAPSDRRRVERRVSMAIGNDYNDLDLLDWADLPFVVGNAPDELRGRYPSVAANHASGFSDAVRRALSESALHGVVRAPL